MGSRRHLPMEDAIKQGQLFLSELTAEERSCLYNDLLSIKDVYLCNKDTSFYTFRKSAEQPSAVLNAVKGLFFIRQNTKANFQSVRFMNRSVSKIIIVSRSYSMDKRWNTLFSKLAATSP